MATLQNRRIFILTTDDNQPSGGRWILYQLVEMLRGRGLDARVLHQRAGFRYDWFPNDLPVCYTYQFEQVRAQSWRKKLRYYGRTFAGRVKNNAAKTERVIIDENDLLVLPAARTARCQDFLPGVPKIALSQNPYMLLPPGCADPAAEKVLHPDIIGRIAMSRLNYDWHRFVFPDVPTYEVPVFLSSQTFSYTQAKKKQIAYMPRKLKRDSALLINMLRVRGKLDGFSFLPIDGMSHAQVAQAMRESLIFLSFSHREGFGLPPAEAMACGCIVIGYTGNAGDEFFTEETGYPIPDGDLQTFAQTVESITEEYNRAPARLDEQREKASQKILTTYTRENTEAALLEAFEALGARLP